MYTCFDTEVITVSATTVFLSLCFEYIAISLSCSHDFIDVLYNLLPLYTHILSDLRLDSSNICSKALAIVIPFLYFKRTIIKIEILY